MQQHAGKGVLLALISCLAMASALDIKPKTASSTISTGRTAPGTGTAHAGSKAAGAAAASDGADDLVCVVIRTYWKHGSYGDNALVDLLHSLKAQHHQKWVALLLVMDNRPFPELRHVVREVNDTRVWVFAEWISTKYAPRTPDGNAWTLHYHSKLYNLTDEAIRVCPRTTEWLMVTNGDNLYDPSYMSEVVKRKTADVVTFDYYTRFQRITAPQCHRFAAEPGAPPCKTNGMRWCHTDLAAAAWYWPKFVEQDLRYGPLDSGYGVGHDGNLAELALSKGWKAEHVPGRCLLNHSPSPQQCALANGTWDDTAAPTMKGTGGRCLASAQATWVAMDMGSKVEVVDLEVTHDGSSFGVQPGQVLRLPCIRYKEPKTHADMERFFGPRCRSQYDMDNSGQGGALQGAGRGMEMNRQELASAFGLT